LSISNGAYQMRGGEWGLDATHRAARKGMNGVIV
jgi:hypothetical protein